MPAEWAPHARCWMAWPCRPDLFGERMAAVRRTVAEVARSIADYEPVTMLARPDLTAEASLQCGKGISVLPLDYDDSWTRDFAPTFLCGADGGLAGIDWGFNGYGGRVPAFAASARLAEAICERLGAPRFTAPLVLEGGAIQVDGEGTCLAAAPAILDPGRNPGVDREQAAQTLCDHLGVEVVIWLEHGFEGDEAGGHLDNVAAFVRPGVVLALTSQDPDDGNHAGLAANLERLKEAKDARGRSLEVIEIAQPAARFKADGRRLVTSYVNLYVANDAVLVPMFDDAADRAARRAIANAFPEHHTAQVEVSDLVYGGRGLHGITHAQPVCAPRAGE